MNEAEAEVTYVDKTRIDLLSLQETSMPKITEMLKSRMFLDAGQWVTSAAPWRTWGMT